MIELTQEQRTQVAREEVQKLIDADSLITLQGSALGSYHKLMAAGLAVSGTCDVMSDVADSLSTEGKLAAGLALFSDVISIESENLYNKANIIDGLLGVKL